MRYSVYNHDTHRYDYYEGPGPGGTHAGAPPVSLGTSEYGATPDQLAWKLPVGARKVGSGELAVGRVASTGAASSLGDIASGSAVKLGIVAALAYLVWRHR